MSLAPRIPSKLRLLNAHRHRLERRPHVILVACSIIISIVQQPGKPGKPDSGIEVDKDECLRPIRQTVVVDGVDDGSLVGHGLYAAGSLAGTEELV